MRDRIGFWSGVKGRGGGVEAGPERGHRRNWKTLHSLAMRRGGGHIYAGRQKSRNRRIARGGRREKANDLEKGLKSAKPIGENPRTTT